MKGPKKVYTIWGLNLIVSSEKGVSCSVSFTSYCVQYMVRDNAKKFTSVGLSYNDVILFSKIFCMFDVVYVKSNSISCEFSGLNIVATLPNASEGIFMTTGT